MKVWLMVNRKTGEVAEIAPRVSASAARTMFCMTWRITQKQASGAGWRAVEFVPANSPGLPDGSSEGAL